MSHAQAERALEMLYGDASARDELTDDEAQELFRWGEEQIARLAALELDDEQFNAAYEDLRKLITRINRFTSRRSYQTPEEQQAAVDNIAASAQAVTAYLPSAQAAPAPDFAAYLQQQPTLDNIANIQALTRLIVPPTPGEQPPYDEEII